MPYIFYFFSNLSEHFRLKYLEWGRFKNNSFKKIPKETGMVVFSGKKISELSVGYPQRLLLLEVCRPALRSDAWGVEAAVSGQHTVVPAPTECWGLGPAPLSGSGPEPAARCSARRALRCGCGLRSVLFGVHVVSSPLAC